MSHDNESVALLPPHSHLPERFINQLVGVLGPLIDKVAEALRTPPPFMVTKEEAAARCQMSTTTYDKYMKQKLLPPMNATGRVSLEALRAACLKLDGVRRSNDPVDPAEAALAAWERGEK